MAKVLGLTLSNNKSIICEDVLVRGTILYAIPGVQVIALEKDTLLGSPFGDVPTINASVKGSLI